MSDPKTILNILAKMSGFSDIKRTVHYDIEWGEHTNTTPVFDMSLRPPYDLKPITVGWIKPFKRDGIYKVPDEYKGIVGIHRSMVGYGLASQMNTTEDMTRLMMPTINNGIRDLINQFGDIENGYKITMEIYNEPGVYFKEIESAAAYEINLTLYKGIT